MFDDEIRRLMRRLKEGDPAVFDKILMLADRLDRLERDGLLAALFGEQLEDALRRTNEQRRARTVTLARAADRLSRGDLPAMIRGGVPPMKRREAPNCLETVLHVEPDGRVVRVRSGVVLYEGRDHVEIDIVTFASEAPAVILWASQYARSTAVKLAASA